MIKNINAHQNWLIITVIVIGLTNPGLLQTLGGVFWVSLVAGLCVLQLLITGVWRQLARGFLIIGWLGLVGYGHQYWLYGHETVTHAGNQYYVFHRDWTLGESHYYFIVYQRQGLLYHRITPKPIEVVRYYPNNGTDQQARASLWPQILREESLTK